MILLLIAIPLQIIGLIVPELRIASFWFVLGALPLLLPAPLMYQAQQKRPVSEPQDPISRATRPPASQSTSSAQTEFPEQLRRVQAVLAKHPQGLTLVEIGRELGVEWRRLTGAVNELLRLKRIRKEGKRYFHQSGR
jgi:hypothetical protein